ncbi:MAG TPA: hypothetical protein VFF06_07005, partial [Polyangia bacterium]|nr:hypothetical protein [Polyangia bacterium]
ATSADALRRKAEELATSGRCEEAVKLYQELEKKYPTFVVSPRDRLPYVRCLRATGNEQLANDLDRRIDNNAAPPAASQQQMETVVAPSSTAHSERAAKAKAKPAKKSSRAVDESTLAPAKK